MTSRRSLNQDFNIPEKANKILYVILLVLLLIVLRIWQLSVIQYDQRIEEFRKPQRKVIVEPARRATIRDRYNVPLAINKIQYQASILYSQFRQIPAVAWTKDSSGKKIKIYKRKEYIKALASKIANELALDPERLEDQIYSKAAFYYHIPFIIKEDLSEQEYYRIKMLENEWVGIQAQRLPKRTYPKGRLAADIIGYMGAINRQEYEGIIQEMHALEKYLAADDHNDDQELPQGIESPSQARQRLKELQQRAYTINDSVGKTGVEAQFEEELRGFQGCKSYYSDARGNFLRELPGSKPPLPGQRILLTISSELQEFAEELLIKNERIREAQVSHPDPANPSPNKQPWIKGGAILAIDPNNGELLAMASYPRFDPNDFIPSGNQEINNAKNANIARWLESEHYIAQLWDQRRPLERERFDDEQACCFDEKQFLTWKRYLEFILPQSSAVLQALERVANLKNSVALLKSTYALLEISQQDSLHTLLQVLYPADPYQGKKLTSSLRLKIESNLEEHENYAKLKESLDQFLIELNHNYEKALLLDLCRLVIDERKFSDRLLKYAGGQSLENYRNSSAAMASIEPLVKGMAKTLFHTCTFSPWRQKNEKEFLKQKRLEEKIALVRYPKPYLDYLDECENQQFAQFWSKNRWNLINVFLLGKPLSVSEELALYFPHFLQWFHEIAQGAHQNVQWLPAYSLLQETLQKIPAALLQEYLQTFRNYYELERPLFGKYRHMRKHKGVQLEKDLAAAFYPVYGYGYGRSFAYRQATTQGSLFKLVTGYAALAQRYRELEKTGIKITSAKMNPLEIIDKIERHGKEVTLGYYLDGTPIPQHYKGGRLVRSQKSAMGKVDLVRALEESSNPYFSLLAAEYLKHPEQLIKAARLFSYGAKTGIDLPAEIKGSVPSDVIENKTGLYSMAIGQHTLVVTPLQTAVMLSAIANGGKIVIPKIVRMTVESQDHKDLQIVTKENYAYKESLNLVGIDFPLFTKTIKTASESLVNLYPSRQQRQLFMPNIVREMLLNGMERVFGRMMHSGIGALSNFYRDYPEAISDCLDLKDQLVGKTSTSEVVENIDLDRVHGSDVYTHVWFGGISFDPEDGTQYISYDKHGKPELVVVVYLKFGKFGRESAPVAAQVINKWREIKHRHAGESQ